MGFFDTKVKYWQTLKTVARLRKCKTDNNILLLKTDLYGGHSGYSNNIINERAFIYAFILDNLGIKY